MSEQKIRRLAEHLAYEVIGTDNLTGDCEVVGFSGGGRCIEPAVAVRWESGFADKVCQQHAERAEGRGVLVVYAKRHDGKSP